MSNIRTSALEASERECPWQIQPPAPRRVGWGWLDEIPDDPTHEGDRASDADADPCVGEGHVTLRVRERRVSRGANAFVGRDRAGGWDGSKPDGGDHRTGRERRAADARD